MYVKFYQNIKYYIFLSFSYTVANSNIFYLHNFNIFNTDKI